MKQNPSDPSPKYKQQLHHKFSQMSVLQLRKQKLQMVEDLQQINALLDDMITQQVQETTNFSENIDFQTMRIKRLRSSLEKSLVNFQWMLSGDYGVKAEQQLKRLKINVKKMREQVSQFNRILSVPMQKDHQICQKLQNQMYRLQRQIQQTRQKNLKKQKELERLKLKIQNKQKGVKKVLKQIQQFKDELEFQQKSPQQHAQNMIIYNELIAKKDKYLTLIQKEQKRYSLQYKNKTKKFKQLEQTSYQIQHYLNQIEDKLQQRNEEVRQAKQKRKKMSIAISRINSDLATAKINFNDFGRMGNNRKIKTQQNSLAQIELQSLEKKRQKYKQSIRLASYSSHPNKFSASSDRLGEHKDNHDKEQEITSNLTNQMLTPKSKASSRFRQKSFNKQVTNSFQVTSHQNSDDQNNQFQPSSLRKFDQKNNYLLPRLYKALGKTRLQIEEDCDIKDLIY